MVHYTGAITVPQNQTISFMVAADDGGTVKIGDTAEFGTWNLKGCQWSAATTFASVIGSADLMSGSVVVDELCTTSADVSGVGVRWSGCDVVVLVSEGRVRAAEDGTGTDSRTDVEGSGRAVVDVVS